jgi:hypothetical protein
MFIVEILGLAGRIKSGHPSRLRIPSQVDFWHRRFIWSGGVFPDSSRESLAAPAKNLARSPGTKAWISTPQRTRAMARRNPRNPTPIIANHLKKARHNQVIRINLGHWH